MNRFVIPLGVFALLAGVLAIGIKHAPDKSLIRSVLIGKPAPAFKLQSLTDSNRLVSATELRGRPYLLNVWGTWCPECRVEHAMLLEIKRAGVAPLIGVSWQDEDAAVLAYFAKEGNPYDWALVDRDGRTAIDWGVYGAPETFLVNANGMVIYKHVGALTREVWMREFLPRLNGQRAASP